jgi:hypothetical protein
MSSHHNKFKAEIRAGLMKKEGQFKTLALVKYKAKQFEHILEKRKKKSTIGTKGTNGNGSKPRIISQINGEDLEIIATFNDVGKKIPNHFHPQNKNGGPVKCTNIKKSGDTVDKCFMK